jgi:TolA-binding protein
MKDHLRHLLDHVDEVVPPAAVRTDLAARVKERASRRRRRRRFAVAGLVVLCAASGVFVLATLQRSPMPVAAVAPDLKRKQSDIAALNIDANAHLKVASAIRQARQVRQLNARIRELDPVQQLNERCLETASILLRNADNLFQEPRQRPEAIQAYRALIRLFPDSPSARQAQDHLREQGA